jgi:hypothetical protein
LIEEKEMFLQIFSDNKIALAVLELTESGKKVALQLLEEVMV